MNLTELASKAEQIDLDMMVLEAVEANSDRITDLNRAQMQIGLTAIDSPITPPYRSNTYADVKKQMGSRAPFGIPDLLLTGSFQAEMQTAVDDRTYEVFSTDDKAPDLFRKYPNVFGLTPDNKEKMKAVNSRTLAQMFKKATGLK
jgi:hypothetical protein